MLYYEGLVRDMLRINSLRKVIVPFWGGELLHDEISMVNGAFSQAISGIENLKRIAGHVSVAASITVIKKNRKLLSGLVSLLHEKGVDEFNFIYLKSLNNCVKVPDEDLPVMSDIVSEFEKIKDFLAPFKKQLYFEGLPMCILKGFKANLTEPYHPFDKVIPYNNKEIVSCIKARESDKQKFKFCAAYKEMPWCEGVWKVYAKKHGNSEFRPC